MFVAVGGRPVEHGGVAIDCSESISNQRSELLLNPPQWTTSECCRWIEGTKHSRLRTSSVPARFARGLQAARLNRALCFGGRSRPVLCLWSGRMSQHQPVVCRPKPVNGQPCRWSAGRSTGSMASNGRSTTSQSWSKASGGRPNAGQSGGSTTSRCRSNTCQITGSLTNCGRSNTGQSWSKASSGWSAMVNGRPRCLPIRNQCCM